MNVLKIVLSSIWKCLFVLNFILGLVILYPFFSILLSNEKWFPLAFALKRFWAKWILFFPGIRVSLKSEMDLNKLPQPCVFCANHTSYLDIIVSYIVIPNYFVYMAKQELDKAPLFRIFFKKMNILVDRKSKIGSHKAFVKAGEEIDKGHSVFLFPEGTISKDGILKPFKNGPFKLAIEKQIPIVPITFANNWTILQNGGFLKATGCPGVAKVVIHDAIETKGMTEENLVDLRTKVHEKITSSLIRS